MVGWNGVKDKYGWKRLKRVRDVNLDVKLGLNGVKKGEIEMNWNIQEGEKG